MKILQAITLLIAASAVSTIANAWDGTDVKTGNAVKSNKAIWFVVARRLITSIKTAARHAKAKFKILRAAAAASMSGNHRSGIGRVRDS